MLSIFLSPHIVAAASMLWEPTFQTNDFDVWKPKIESEIPPHSGALSSVDSLTTSSKQYLSGADIVPELSFKTSGSSDAKSITPEKDHDVIMDEADEGAAAASAGGSDSGSDGGVAVASGGGGNKDDAASDGENSSDGDKDATMEDADNSDSDAPEKDEEGADSDGASLKASPMDKLAEAVDRRASEADEDGSDEAGTDAENKANTNKDAGEGKKSNATKSAGDEEKNKAEGGDAKHGKGKEEKSDNTAQDLEEKSGAKKDSEKKSDGEKKDEPAVPEGPLPLLVGTLAYSDRENLRRHIIRGNWKYDNSHAVPPQRFELIRTIPPEEDLKQLPKDGEFAGSFNVQHSVKTSKGKIKFKNRAVPENGVKLTFKGKEDEEDGLYSVKGQGTNEFGVFELFGTAKKNTGLDAGEDPTYSVSVHKRYVTVPSAPPAAASEGKAKEGKSKDGKKDKKRKHVGDADDEPKPPPTELPTEGICLQGKLVRNTSDELSLDNAAVHRIMGLWALKGPAQIRDNPETCEKFEYEHKCSGDKTVFPLSGRYTGFFYVSDAGQKTKVAERDVTLKFKLNAEGSWNVEGKGSNFYGKYNITGMLEKDGTLTLFRIFQAPKVKVGKKSTQVKLTAPGANGSARSSPKAVTAASTAPSNSLSFDDVDVPDEGEVPAPLTPPEHFSATSRGILKIENDGTHTCTGSWALTNEHFQGGLTSKYHFGIQAHDAAEDADAMLEIMKTSGLDEDDNRKIKNLSNDGVTPSTLANSTFPIDSARYKGSFKLRKGTRTQTIVDQQIVLKYVKNSGGSYNVYGKGTNEVGTFDLVGTLILQGRSNGLMQLYRIYPPAPAEPIPPAPIGGGSRKSSKVFQGGLTEKATKENSGPAPAMKPPERFVPSMSGLQRRESSRMSRLPSRLEEDDPQAQMERYMERCSQILQEMQEADPQKVFALPVDPVALGVPQYPEIIKNPMDLGTIETRMDSNEVDSPDEFARLVRLTFQNAITFNTLPDNPVHILARHLLGVFNKKFGTIDKSYNAAKKNKKLTKAERQDLRRKEKEAAKETKRQARVEKERKRKADVEASNESKRMKLENVVASTRSAMLAIEQAAPSDPDANVTREEYNLLLSAIKQVQEQIVGLHKLVKKGSTFKSTSDKAASDASYAPYAPYAEDVSTQSTYQPSKPKKKKAKKEVESEPEPEWTPPSPKVVPTPAPVVEEPLSFEEQEALSEAINLLPERLLPGAMQIIRESEIVNDDDDEIDLDIDQLDTKTQRKLQSFVMENVKTKKKKKPKKAKQTAAPVPAPAPAAPAKSPSPPLPEEKPESSSKSRLPGGKSFFALGDDDDSDDDKEEDDEEEDIKTDFATNWNMAEPDSSEKKEEEAAGVDSNKDEDDGDDLWGQARKEAEDAKVLEADRIKREEKMKAEALAREERRMAEAQELGEQARAKRDAELKAEQEREAEEARKAEEAKQAAREEARREVEEEKQEIDLEATRDIMAKYEQEFNDNFSAGASPSSDFGF